MLITGDTQVNTICLSLVLRQLAIRGQKYEISNHNKNSAALRYKSKHWMLQKYIERAPNPFLQQ